MNSQINHIVYYQIDYILNEIRRSSELGEVHQVLTLAHNLKIVQESENVEQISSGCGVKYTLVHKNGDRFIYYNLYDLCKPLYNEKAL